MRIAGCREINLYFKNSVFVIMIIYSIILLPLTRQYKILKGNFIK